MKDPISDNEDKSVTKEPLFIKRDDNLGWTINFKRPISFLILVLFLAVVVVLCLFSSGSIKL